MKLFRYVVGLVFIMGLTSFPTAFAGPLHEAIEANDLDRVRELIAQGEPVNSKDEDGRSALYVAALEGHLPVIKQLVGSGADVNGVTVTPDGDRWTPLIIAAYVGNKDIVDFLVSHGADIDTKDNHGYTALSWAMKEGYSNTVRLLITRGADVNVSYVHKQGPHYFPTLLLGAFITYVGEDADIPLLLIKHGADINAKDARGATPLHHAVWELDHLPVVKLLLERGANINAKDKYGSTPLHRAVTTIAGQTSIVEFLIENGADVNAESRSILVKKGTRNIGKVRYTPLHKAVFIRRLDVVELLIERGASMHVESTVSTWGLRLYYEQTPLGYAELLAEHAPTPEYREDYERIADFLRSQL